MRIKVLYMVSHHMQIELHMVKLNESRIAYGLPLKPYSGLSYGLIEPFYFFFRALHIAFNSAACVLISFFGSLGKSPADSIANLTS